MGRVTPVTPVTAAVGGALDGAERWAQDHGGSADSADNVDNAGDGDHGAAHAATEAAETSHMASDTSLVTLVRDTARASTVDLAKAAWLHAKEQKSQSVKTRTTYAAILAEFRQVLRAEGLDLDAADPRHARALLTATADEQGSAERQHHPDHQEDYARVEQLVAERTAALALAAQAYASRPAVTPYGARPVAATTANLRLAALSSF